MTDPSAFIDLVFRYLVALAVSTPRALALFSVLPLTGRLGLPPFFRNAVVLALSIPIILPIERQLAANPVPVQAIFFLSLKEVVLGLIIGVILGIPFWAIEAAGNIIDFVRQAPDAEVQDPQGTTEASITGTLFSITATFYYIAMGGLTLLFNSVYTSFDIWPPLQPLPAFDPLASAKLISMLDYLLRSALILSAPLVIVMLVSLVALMIIARFTPQINVFDLSMSFRNLAFVIVMQVYALFIFDYFSSEIATVKRLLDSVKGLFL
jgi:type III secretion protein T